MIWWRLVSLLLKSAVCVIGRPVCFWDTNGSTIKIQVLHPMVARLLTVGKWSDEFPRLYPTDLAHLWITMLLFWDQCHMIVYSFGLIFSCSVCNHEFNIEWSSLYHEIVLGCVACVELVLWIHPVRKLYSIPISLQCLISHIYSLCIVRWALWKPSNGLTVYHFLCCFFSHKTFCQCQCIVNDLHLVVMKLPLINFSSRLFDISVKSSALLSIENNFDKTDFLL